MILRLDETDKALYDDLSNVSEAAVAAWSEGRVDEARALGDDFWARMPEPKHEVDLLSQVPMFIAFNALQAGYIDDAELWNERVKPWAEGTSVAPTAARISLIDGGIALARGDEDRAYEAFDEAFSLMGRRAFQDKDPRYWEFYASRSGRAMDGSQASGSSLVDAAAKGEELLEAGQVTDAIDVWEGALEKLTPGTDLELEFWLRGSLGDAYFLAGEWASGMEHLKAALPIGGVENAYVWLRLGQCQFEQGLKDEAANSLMSGYMLDGDEIWEGEDPKYRQLLVDRGLIR